MMNHAATEADDGRTLTIGVFYVVDILGCLHTLLFAPLLDGLPQTRGVNEAAKATEPGDCLLNPGLVLSRATAKLGHLLERGVRHLGHQDTAG